MNKLTKIISGILITYTAGSFAMDRVRALDNSEQLQRRLIMKGEKWNRERQFRLIANDTIDKRNDRNHHLGLPFVMQNDYSDIAFQMRRRDAEKSF